MITGDNGLEWTLIEIMAGGLLTGVAAWGGLIWTRLGKFDSKLTQLIKELNADKTNTEVRLSRIEYQVAAFTEALSWLRGARPVLKGKQIEGQDG